MRRRRWGFMTRCRLAASRAWIRRRSASRLKPIANDGSAPAPGREQTCAARHRRSRQESERPLCAEPMVNDCGDAGFRVMTRRSNGALFETRKPASPALQPTVSFPPTGKANPCPWVLPTQKRRDLSAAAFKCRGKLLTWLPSAASGEARPARQWRDASWLGSAGRPDARDLRSTGHCRRRGRRTRSSRRLDHR